MSNSFTTVTNTGFLGRIGNSIAGLFIGPILILGAIALLWWNEGRAVQAIVGVGEAGKMVVEGGGAPLPANDTKLVHVTAPVSASGPVADGDLNLSFDKSVVVARTAEIYEWREKKTEKTEDKIGGGQQKTTTYEYEKVWSGEPLDSSKFQHPEGHENPEMKIQSKTFTAPDAKIGEYGLDDTTAGMLTPGDVAEPDAPDGWTKDAGKYINGDKAEPKVGDQRVSYKSLASGAPVSVLARQSGGGFSEYVTGNGYHIQMAQTGDHPAAAMLADKKKQEGALTWILRVVGFGLMFLGFCLLFGPLSAMAAIIPFAGSLVRGAAGLAALVISIPVSFVVIALAWVVFRPVVGIILLAVAAAIGWGLWTLHKKRSPTPVAAAPEPAKA